MSTLLNLSNINLSFGDTQVLRGASLSLAQGEIACLLGQSGCGKTSLLRSIAGFETPQQGSVELNDITLFDAQTGENTAIESRDIAFVFQDYALFPHLSVSQNIAFGLKHQGIKPNDYKNDVDDILSLLSLATEAKKYPHQLSGGQQQRVAIGRALALRPKLLLLDEPFSNLDVHLREHLAHEMRQLIKHKGISALMVTHDQQEAFAFADRIAVMHHGNIEQYDSADALYHHPKTPFVGRFISDGCVIEQSLFKTLQSNIHDSSHVLIRPEHVKLTDENTQETHKATVQKCLYRGFSLLLLCELDTLPGVQIPVYCSSHEKIREGQLVQLCFEIENLTYIGKPS